MSDAIQTAVISNDVISDETVDATHEPLDGADEGDMEFG
jgi:hypothetical protein